MTTRARDNVAPPVGSAPAVSWTHEATGGAPPAVEAGTLLGTAAAGTEAEAGDGVVALVRPDGVVELRASRDGLPRREGCAVRIDPLHEIEGTVDRAMGDRDVRGVLRVGGHVSAGRLAGATGAVHVAGMVDRGTARAGGELAIGGRAGGALLEAGAAVEMRRALVAALDGAVADLEDLASLTLQIVAAGRERGSAVPLGRAVTTLRDRRHPDLVERLRRAETIVGGARRGWPGLAPALARELAAARAIVTDPDGAPDPVAGILGAGAFLAAATAGRPPVDPPGVRVAAAHGTTIACPGALRLTGAGISDCDVDVGGDLIAVAAGGAVRGGYLRVGGRLRVGELAGREGAPLRIVMHGVRSRGDRVRADVVHPGVEIAVGGEVIRFDRRRHDLRIGLESGRAVVTAR